MYNTNAAANHQLYVKLRVFVASPNDVAEEREKVIKVIEKLNRSGSLADHYGVILEAIRWETHVRPLMGRPQGVILQQLPVNLWDIFIGILWSRFGTPSGSKKSDNGDATRTGTEEEFQLAYDSWRKLGKPQISFYRCTRMPGKRFDHIDPEELQQVKNFFSNFSHDGKHPGLYSSFSDAEELEKLLMQNLSGMLQSCKSEIEVQRNTLVSDYSLKSVPKRSLSTAPIEIKESVPLIEEMNEGKKYDVSFLSVDISGHSDIVKRFRGSQSEVQKTLGNFKALATQIANSQGGDIFHWAGDGGILIFLGENHCDQAALAGIRLLHETAIFCRDIKRCYIGEIIQIRLAANKARIEFLLPTSSIVSDELNYTVKLQEKGTNNNEFCIAAALYEKMNSRICSLFEPKGRFGQGQVFSFEVHPAFSKEPIELSLSEQLRDFNEVSDEIHKAVSHGSNFLPMDLSVSLDKYYSIYEKFCRSYRVIDERWSDNYVKTLHGAVSEIVHSESCNWDNLQKIGLIEHRDSNYDEELEAILDTFASRRARPVVILRRFESKLKYRLEGKESSKSVTAIKAEFLVALQYLLDADELSEEMALTDLLLNFPKELSRYLHVVGENSRQTPLIDKLWQLADLIVQQSVYSWRQQDRTDDWRFINLLADSPISDPRFKILKSILTRKEYIGKKIIESLYPENEDTTQLIWRCLLIGRSDKRTRRLAASQLHFDPSSKFSMGSIGRMIARNRIPIDSLFYIGLNLRNDSSVEKKKLFFDCIRRRVEDETRFAKSKKALEEIAKVMSLFLEYSFLAEARYYSRFKSLFDNFIVSIKRLGFKIARFEEIFSVVIKAHLSQPDVSGKLPTTGKTPPLMQRRLAGEAPYLFLFVGHTDPSIAIETLPNINSGNVIKVLRIPEISGNLLFKIVSGKLGNHTQVKVAALKHAKCPLKTAARLMDSFKKSKSNIRDLKSIVMTAQRPEIRIMARRKMEQFAVNLR